MAYERDPEHLRDLLRAFTEEEEQKQALQRAVDETGATATQLRAEVERKILEREDEIWREAAVAIEERNKIESDLESSKKRAFERAGPEPTFLGLRVESMGIPSGIAVALVVAIGVVYSIATTGFAAFVKSLSIGSVMVILFAAGIVARLLEGALKAIGSYRVGRWEARLEREEKESGVEDASKRLQEADKRVDFQLVTEGIQKRWNKTLNLLRKDDYSTVLPEVQAGALKLEFDPVNAIETAGRARIDGLIRENGEGSIGIAGPRGAGKTTLMAYFCREQAWETESRGERKQVLSIMTPAPVEYDTQDFILHLFSSLCRRACTMMGEDPDRPFRAAAGERARGLLADPWIRMLAWVCGPIGVLVLVLGLILGGALLLESAPAGAGDGLVAEAEATAEVDSGEGAPAGKTATPAEVDSGEGAPPSKTATTAEADSGEGAPPSKTATTAEADSGEGAPPSKTATTAEADSGEGAPPSLADRMIDAFNIDPGGMVLWGLVLAATSAAVISRGRPRSGRRHQGQGESPGSDVDRDLLNLALKNLRDIRFQQSITSDWSGSLSLPVGVSAEVSGGESLERNPMTFPDIVDRFRAFVSQASGRYHVLLGVDEVDKMLPDNAQKFLNDIKVVLDFRSCFFFVSVSESAMSDFERRGLPFRNVFDSSFAEIVYADYLRLADSRQLINSRTLGMPVPFQYLCHCLSGGLARDLVRVARTLVDQAERSPDDRSLPHLTACVVAADLRGKIRALRAAATQTGNGADAFAFLRVLDRLAVADVSANALWSSYGELSAEDCAVSDSQLEDLAREFGSYLYFATTVLDYFRGGLDEPTLQAAEQLAALERLAEARQALALNPMLSRSIVEDVRSACGLAERQA